MTLAPVVRRAEWAAMAALLLCLYDRAFLHRVGLPEKNIRPHAGQQRNTIIEIEHNLEHVDIGLFALSARRDLRCPERASDYRYTRIERAVWKSVGSNDCGL